jgi:hypothetical protein
MAMAMVPELARAREQARALESALERALGSPQVSGRLVKAPRCRS